MPDPITYASDGTVATITLDDGKVNALSIATLQAIHAAVDRAEADGVAVLLTGRAGVFSAGFDLKVFQAGGAALAEMLTLGATLMERLLGFPRPVVVAASGSAVAAGGFLLLTADQALIAEGDFRVGLNEVQIGLTLPHFGVALAKHAIAPALLDRAVLQAELFDPAGAVAAGFAERVVPADDLLTEAHAVATRLATTLNAAAYTGTKQRLLGPAIEAQRAALALDQSEWASWAG